MCCVLMFCIQLPLVKRKFKIGLICLFIALVLLLTLAEYVRHKLAMPSYPQFLSDFKKSCATYYLLDQLPVSQKDSLCACMQHTVETRVSNMTELQTWIAKNDRFPRGYGDFVPGAVRITLEQCQKDARLTRG